MTLLCYINYLNFFKIILFNLTYSSTYLNLHTQSLTINGSASASLFNPKILRHVAVLNNLNLEQFLALIFPCLSYQPLALGKKTCPFNLQAVTWLSCLTFRTKLVLMSSGLACHDPMPLCIMRCYRSWLSIELDLKI